MRHIYKCTACGKYTMNESCACGSATIAAKPLKFSLDDRLAPYRSAAKLEDYKKRGMI